MPIIQFLKTSDNTYPDISADNPLPTTSQISGGTVTADTELPAASPLGELMANPTTPLVGAALMTWGVSGWNRFTGNLDTLLIAGSSRTVTNSSATQLNHNFRGMHVSLTVTNAGTGDITLKIEGFNPFTSNFHTLLEGLSVTTVSATEYKIYPGFTAVANSVANDILHRSWRVTVTHNNANPITYSVAAMQVI